MALAWLLPSGLTLLMGTAPRAPAPAVHMRVVEEVKAAQLSKSEPVAGMVVPAGLKGLSDKVALVGPLTLDAHPEAEAYLGVYTKGMLASRTNPYERIGYYEMVGNPNRMIWWADGVWAVGQGNSKGGRIGVVCVDDQAEAPEVRRSGYSPARVFMLGPPGMTAQSVAPQAARVAPAGAASVVSSVAPAKPKPDRYAPPPVKVDPRFDANAQPMSSFTPAATENRDFQPQALKTQNVAGGQGPADAWTTVRNTKPKPSRTKKGQLEERVARVRATTDGAVEARTKEILKAPTPPPPPSLSGPASTARYLQPLHLLSPRRRSRSGRPT